ncbi:MAG: hypothetical protein AB1502_11645 [Thermodesulfobacteriota bacterium]
MISINKIFFCDQLSEAPFGKLNILGCNLSDIIVINEVPYILQTTLILEGKISRRLHSSNLSLKLVYQNLQGNLLNEETIEVATIPPVNEESRPLIISIPFRWIITEYGDIDIIVFIDTEQVFKESFKVLQGDAPNIRLTGPLKFSALLPIESEDFSLKALVGSASRELILIDQYLEPVKLFEIVSLTPQSAYVKVLTRPNLKPQYSKYIATFQTLPNPIEIKFNTTFHDRFVIVNKTECFHFGYSLEKLKGKRISRYSKMIRQDEVEQLKNKFNSEWLRAESL